MSKRKSEESLVRFVWKRNSQYDLALLEEVESKNPFAFKNQKPVWCDIAVTLQNSSLKMKVTERSCRERTKDLLDSHRKDELDSIRASGITENEMSQLQLLLTSIAKLQEAKPDSKIKDLYSKKERKEAENIREVALGQVDDGDYESIDDDLEVHAEGNKGSEEEDDDKNNSSPKLIPKRRRWSNPKQDLISFLETKNEKENELRREEARIREMEAQNKRTELEILRQKTEADVEERKKFTELLIKLASKE